MVFIESYFAKDWSAFTVVDSLSSFIRLKITTAKMIKPVLAMACWLTDTTAVTIATIVIIETSARTFTSARIMSFLSLMKDKIM